MKEFEVASKLAKEIAEGRWAFHESKYNMWSDTVDVYMRGVAMMRNVHWGCVAIVNSGKRFEFGLLCSVYLKLAINKVKRLKEEEERNNILNNIV